MSGLRFHLFLIIVLLSVFPGCGGRHPHQPPVLPPNSLQFICQARGIEWQYDSISQIFTFNAMGRGAKVLVGSNLVIFGDQKIILSETVERKNNMIIVPADFVEKVFGQGAAAAVRPEVRPAGAAFGKCREIMVDAGHGGKDSGARGLASTIEKEITMDIARRLKTDLEAQGFKVSMTRDSDEYISLPQRTEIATASKADLFVSIHANSTKNKKIKGLEIYYSRGLEQESDLTQRKLNEKAFLKKLSVNNDSVVVGKIVKDMMYSNKQIESVNVADRIINKTSKIISTPDRGSRTCGFFVVKNTLIPAILFEVGYLSNSSEAKLLKTDEYRQKIADAIAASIVEYSNDT